MSVETAGGVPPIMYSWSINGEVVRVGPEPTFELFADNKVGIYSIGCSAAGANRDLVSCNSEVTVNGIDPKVPTFNVTLDGNPDRGTLLNIDDLFVFYGTSPGDYDYETEPTPTSGPFQVFLSGEYTFVEIPGITERGGYTLRAVSKTNPSDVDEIYLFVNVATSYIEATERPVEITTGGIVRMNELFIMRDCDPSMFIIRIIPDYDGTVQLIDNNNAIMIPNGTPTDLISVELEAGDPSMFVEGKYRALNNIVVR